MRRLMSGAMILVTAVALGPLQVAAQQGGGGGGAGISQRARARTMGPRARWMGHRGPVGVEAVMRMRERLALTNDQFERLDAVRQEAVRRRVARQAAMTELRSRVMVGEATRGALVDSMTAWRKEASAARKDERSRVEAILTKAQNDTLRTLIARRRAFAAGRASAMRAMRQGMWRRGGGFMPGRDSRTRSGGWARPGGAMSRQLMPPLGWGHRWMSAGNAPDLPAPPVLPDSAGVAADSTGL